MRSFLGHQARAKMDNYRVLERLGKGAQGAVYLAENNADRKKYVLKQVECKDENEANQAFREAMTLKALRHTNVCSYKEFFVTWDKGLSTMFVCIVMEYYNQGDLGRLLRKEREKGAAIPEGKIQNWLGQIISALVFVHKNDVIHRDLKPSNIFIEGDRIIMGDFGVATVIGDVRTKTRTAVGSMSWMAPEVFDHAYDERSDIWSVGCILIEMVTCSFINKSDIAGKLSEIKHSTRALDTLMASVSREYSYDLVLIIKDMLQRDFTIRPTAVDIAERSYIKDCMAIYPSLVTASRKQESTKTAQRPIPVDQGIDAVTDYLMDFIGDDKSVRRALECLMHLTQEDGSTMNPMAKKVVTGVMKRYLKDAQILKLGLQIFRNITPMASEEDDTLYKKETIHVIIEAMKENQENLEIQKLAIGLLMGLAADDTASQTIGQCGGVKAVITTMRLFSHQVDIVTPCCNALWTLAVSEDNARIMVEERCINDVVSALERHINSVPLVTAASITLLSLLLEEDSMAVATRLNIVSLLLTSIQKHMKEAKVVRNACMTLATIVEEDEENAFRVLMNSQDDDHQNGGLPVIVAAYEQHKDNSEVVETIVALLKELVSYNEIRAEMKHMKIAELVLAPVSKHFKDNPEINSHSQDALTKLKYKPKTIGKSDHHHMNLHNVTH